MLQSRPPRPFSADDISVGRRLLTTIHHGGHVMKVSGRGWIEGYGQSWQRMQIKLRQAERRIYARENKRERCRKDFEGRCLSWNPAERLRQRTFWGRWHELRGKTVCCDPYGSIRGTLNSAGRCKLLILAWRKFSRAVKAAV